MYYNFIIDEVPTCEPLTLAEVKEYLRIDHDLEDNLLQNMIATVRASAEGFLKRSLITQKILLTYVQYVPKTITLPMGPVQSVEYIISYDTYDEGKILAKDYYTLRNDRILLRTEIISVETSIYYKAGYGDNPASIPGSIRQGMLTHINSLYEDRDGVRGIPEQSISLYNSFRTLRI